jgi:Fe-S-cluster containining protein/protein tyrosine phosphatase (PTP) superfamily phosphohydrolase (DUF442 family)
MIEYKLSWITDSLAMGNAPMSYEDLDSLQKQGIRAIVNLCAEYCDLHEIEQGHGFEVYYLPVIDEAAPAEPDLERALDWLDEAIYLGKKVLVHCRCGIGRTATFVTAYLLRKGFGLKLAKKKVEEARAVHSSFSQWRLLRKYSKKSGKLTIREPSLESKRVVDLSPFFHDYEVLLDRMDAVFQDAAAKDRSILSCGLETDACCYELLELTFVEAAYLNHHVNRMLAAHERRSAIERAVEVAGRTKAILRTLEAGEGRMMDDRENLLKSYRASKILCPLNIDGKCTVYPFRPIACRTYGIPAARFDATASAAESKTEKSILVAQPLNNEVGDALTTISANMLYALSSMLSGANDLIFSLADAVSGRFVQKYFELLVRTQDYNLTNGAEQCALESGKDK